MDKMFKVNFNAKYITKFLNETSKKLKDLSPLMKIARVFLKNTVDENFETNGTATGEKWEPWSEKYKKRRAKLNRANGKILNLDGHLRKSIISKSGKDFALVGTSKEYAAIHNFGGDIKRNNKTIGKMPKREFMRLNDYKKEELLAELYIKSEELMLDMRNLKNG